MPIYEYACNSCGHAFEKLMKMSADAPPCPECASEEVRKKVSASAFVLKGSGWYRDHYGLKTSPPGKGGDGRNGGDGGKGGDASKGGDGGGSSSSGAGEPSKSAAGAGASKTSKAGD